jgi:nitroreductase
MHSTLSHHPFEIRMSNRTFQKKPLSADDLEIISNILNKSEYQASPFGNQFRFELIIETEELSNVQIGTYGFIKNPQGYILGCSQNDTQNLFDYAYLLETIILDLTTAGIGTCWLGGRFRKQEAMSHLSMAENEIIPAITPLGYAAENQRLQERMIRNVLRANKRKPRDELFFYETFAEPLGKRGAEFQKALHYVRIGPSAQNKQPWRLVFGKDLTHVHFYVTNPLADHPLYMCEPQYLDIGIAYKHFEAGLAETGISGDLVINEPGIEKPDGLTYISSWYRK